MTPLARLLARLLPPVLVGPALALAYFMMMTAVLLASSKERAQIIYVDVRGK